MATIVDVPDRSLQQRRDALAVGNAIRSKRAVLKRNLKAGRVQLAPLLLDPPEWLKSAKVADIIRAVPSLGRVKINACFARERIAATKTVGGLSDRQRAALVGFLDSRNGLIPPGPAPGATAPEQVASALATANRTRLSRSEIRRQIAAGETTVGDVLAVNDGSIGSMTVFDLLASQHRWGRSRTQRMLAHLNVSESKTVGSLTQRQVNLITDTLAAMGPRAR